MIPQPHPAAEALPPTTPPDLIPTAAAAKLAQCSPSALHRWRLKGRLTGYRRAGRWFWSRAEIAGLFVAVPTPRPVQVPQVKPRGIEPWAEAVLRKNGLIK